MNLLLNNLDHYWLTYLLKSDSIIKWLVVSLLLHSSYCSAKSNHFVEVENIDNLYQLFPLAHVGSGDLFTYHNRSRIHQL
jgi:hypothetical protein